MKTRIHVNQHKIRSNAKTGEREPVLTVKTYKSNTYCKTVNINGPCKVVYSPDNPLPCGAKVWIETEEGVVCDWYLRTYGARAGPRRVTRWCSTSYKAKKIHFNTKKSLQSLFSVVYYVHEIEIPYLLEQKKE